MAGIADLVPWAFQRRAIHLRRMILDWRKVTHSCGWPAFLAMTFSTVCTMGILSPARRIRIRGYRHPVYYRDGTSDLHVVRQVFAHHEYACIANEPDVRYIIDLGANIGCSALYLLRRYTAAKIVVVEPDADNMQMCRRNLAPFADRVTFVQAGVWSASVPMVVERGKYRDGAEWSFQVRPAKPGELPHFASVTVNEIMAAAAFPRIDILKMDIEAAEKEVFRIGYESWLNCTGTLALEMHDEQCKEVVARALAAHPFQGQQSGELTVFRNRH